MINTMDFVIPGICGMGLHMRLDGFRLIYVAIAVWMWAVSGVFSREYMAHYEKKSRYYVFFWATFAATAGVFLSADLFTTFIFFEIMSFTSYVWVAFDEKEESLKAAETYLAVAVIGGMVMLMGLFLLYDLCKTLDMDGVREAAAQILKGNPAFHAAGGFSSPKIQLYTAGGLMLFGFGAKAGCFPLHIWLPKAHPVAPAPASALLSGILTKAGVFGIIIVSCGMFGNEEGWGLLIVSLGLVTMFLGALLAVFSVNLKRTLACSSVSQIGFILTGIGMACLLAAAGESNLLAVRGAFLHMVNHSLIKLVLFLCAGAVYMNLHQLDLNDIRGFGRKKPALCFCFLMGALGIGGIPLWNGYISKTLLHESIVEYSGLLGNPGIWTAAEWVFLFTGGMTVAYMIKLFTALFVDRHPVRQQEFDRMAGSYMRPSSRIVLVASALILPVLGMAPHLTMDFLADLGQGFFGGSGHGHVVSYFSLENLKGGAISIVIGIVFYGVVIRNVLMEAEPETGTKRYVDCWPSWLDLENLLYRPILQTALPGICGAVFGFIDRYLISTAVTVFLAAASVVCRAMDHMADSLILLARKTTHRQLSEPKVHPDGNWTAHAVGSFIDGLSLLGSRLTGKKRRQVSAVTVLIRKEKRMKHIADLVEESFSFGLMLFCLGLCLTLGYLLFVFF